QDTRPPYQHRAGVPPTRARAGRGGRGTQPGPCGRAAQVVFLTRGVRSLSDYPPAPHPGIMPDKEFSNMSERPASNKRLWGLFAFVVLASFSVLGGFGFRIASEAPPIPSKVHAGGQLLFDGELIREGQNVWQSLGGQQIGTVWGHGAYVAPDWSADWLHRELMFILDRWARDEGAKEYDALPLEKQAALRARLKQLIRTNTYDAATDTLT